MNKQNTRINIEINGIMVHVKTGSTVLQACEAVGVEIPRFCYHERLLVAGNCRMCLIEVVGAPKPQAACALPVTLGPGGAIIKIVTDSPLVKKARESVIEILLVNHPLDCPICDQGGECDLQDQSFNFGSDRSRMFEKKRSVEDKDRGPLVNTVMTRCIHCTRCIRFSSEVAGVADRGTSSRGRETEVGTYIEKMMKSERSGNLIDLCPVGALTSKPMAFMNRPQELESTEMCDAQNGMGASIKVQVRGDEVMRVRPLTNDDINGEQLDDKSRFSYDGLHSNRIMTPYVAKNLNGKKTLVQTNSEHAISVGSQIRSDTTDLKVLMSPDVSRETIESVKKRVGGIMHKGVTASIEGMGIPAEPSFDYVNYTFDTKIKNLSEADVVLLIGVDPRKEAPLLNVKRREGFLRGTMKVYSIGNMRDLTFPVRHVGQTVEAMISVARGYHPVSRARAAAKKPAIILGASVRIRKDQNGIRGRIEIMYKAMLKHKNVVPGQTVLNVLHHRANTAGRMKSRIKGFGGFHAQGDVSKSTLLLVGVTRGELKELGQGVPTGMYKYFIAMSSHGDSLVLSSDLLLPLPTFVEKTGHYVNTEGTVQSSKEVVTAALGDNTNDQREVLAKRVGVPFDSSNVEPAPQKVPYKHVGPRTRISDNPQRGPDMVVGQTPRVPAIHDYYTEGNIISRSSNLMSKCSDAFGRSNFRE